MTELTRLDASAICDPRDLRKQISDAIGRTVTCDIDKTKVVVYEDLTAAEKTTAQAVVAAYVYSPPPDPQAELRKAIAAATTLAQLKDALLGKSSAGQVEGRPA